MSYDFWREGYDAGLQNRHINPNDAWNEIFERDQTFRHNVMNDELHGDQNSARLFDDGFIQGAIAATVVMGSETPLEAEPKKKAGKKPAENIEK